MKHSDPQLTRLSELPSSDHHRASVSSTEELWTRVEQLLAVAGGQADSSSPSSVLFENLAKSIDRLRELLNERDRELARLTERSELLARAQAEAAPKLTDLKKRRAAKSGAGQKGSGTAAAISAVTPDDLIRLLSHPQGVRQAILLREILDRPEHRG